MNKILCIFFLTLVALTTNAQDDFDPTLPGEPNALYKVKVGISHSDAGTVSGGGSFATGKKVTVSRSDASLSASSTVFYKFKYWTLNDEEYTTAGTATSFSYTVGTENATFKAVYEEVDPDDVTSKVFLVADPADACTFDNNGKRYLEDTSAYLYYNSSSDSFKFDGWYDENGQQISSTRFFYYTVGKDNATLTARFSYEPVIPGEPSSNQEDVDNGKLGDVNNDGNIDIVDIAALVSYLNGHTPAIFNKSVADTNKDGSIDIGDINGIIDIMNSK